MREARYLRVEPAASYPATSPNSYVVNAGDTLQSIALAVYGDAKLWYLIADANSLKADVDLMSVRASREARFGTQDNVR